MRILFMGNNWVGWQVLKWLKDRHEDVVGLVAHPSSKQKYTEEIIKISGLPQYRVYYGDLLRKPEIITSIKALKADISLSVFFGYILNDELISMFPRGVINLHPAHLPYNRGQYPNVWSIIEGTPSGVTLHYIDRGVDTGDIIAQKEVPIEPVDTGETLYRKLEQASVTLFQETWPLVIAGKAPRVSQRTIPGTSHRSSDVDKIDKIDLDRTYTARELINILRARTFPPYTGAYIIDNGKKVYLRLQLEYGSEKVNSGE